LIKNEHGSILPIMIAITFVIAYLLVMLATQIEVKVASYERTRTYMTMNILEREGLERLEDFLATTEVNESFLETWILRNGAIMTIDGTIRGERFDFSYQIVYNGHVYSRNFSTNIVVNHTFSE